MAHTALRGCLLLPGSPSAKPVTDRHRLAAPSGSNAAGGGLRVLRRLCISKQNRGKQNRNQSTPPLLSGPSWSGSGWRTGDSEIRVTRATPERAPAVTPASSSLLQFGAEVPLPTVAPAFLGLPRRLVPTAPPSPSAGLRGAGVGGPGAEPLAAQCSERPPSATGGTSQPPGHESSQQRVQRSISNRVQRSRSGGQRKLTASPGAQVKGQAKSPVRPGAPPPPRQPRPRLLMSLSQRPANRDLQPVHASRPGAAHVLCGISKALWLAVSSPHTGRWPSPASQTAAQDPPSA
ncbi:synapsin-1-like [Rousettus aegyptiacus]|uniref:synapsin-1-like n=1 Tax=Rousettus aegyptiacus TaxID=9407 RepID=UPI00168CB4D4|nr:synapsin-1-like [Rousettus aegyptiacus]